MDDKTKKALSITVAGFIVYAVTIHPTDEDPHIHPENYPVTSIYENDSTAYSGSTTYLSAYANKNIILI